MSEQSNQPVRPDDLVRELDALIEGACDGVLDASQCERLNELLRSSSALRERYRDTMSLHAALSWNSKTLFVEPARGSADDSPTLVPDTPIARTAVTRWWWPALTVSAALILLAAVHLFTPPGWLMPGWIASRAETTTPSNGTTVTETPEDSASDTSPSSQQNGFRTEPNRPGNRVSKKLDTERLIYDFSDGSMHGWRPLSGAVVKVVDEMTGQVAGLTVGDFRGQAAGPAQSENFLFTSPLFQLNDNPEKGLFIRLTGSAATPNVRDDPSRSAERPGGPSGIAIGQRNRSNGVQGVAVFNTATGRYEKVVLLAELLSDLQRDTYQAILQVEEIHALHDRYGTQQTYRIDVFDTLWNPDGTTNRIEIRTIVIPGHHVRSPATV